MYNTSSDYKQAVLADSTKHVLKLYIGNTQIDSDLIFDFKMGLEMFSDELYLGATPTKTCTFKVHKNAIPSGAVEIEVVSGIEDEEIPMGKYIFNETKIVDDFTIEIKAVDYMKKFEGAYETNLDFTEGKTTLEILQDLCSKSGVALNTQSFVNDDIDIYVYDNTQSRKTYLSYIAEQAGGYAIINRDNQLEIRNFTEATTLNQNLFKSFKWSNSSKVSRIAYEDGVQDYKSGTTTNNTLWLNQKNMYIVSQTQIDNIFDEIDDSDITFNGFEGGTIIDPAIDIGDIVKIDNKQVIFQGKMSYLGKWYIDISSKATIKDKAHSMNTIANSDAKIRRVESEINQIDGTITQYIEETDATISQITDSTADIQGQIVEGQSRINEIESSVDGTTQTITEIVANQNDFDSRLTQLQNTIDGMSLNMTENGGNNIFKYAKEFWDNGVQDAQGNYGEANLIESIPDAQRDNFERESASHLGYTMLVGTSRQVAQVKDSYYTISLKYKKLTEQSICKVYVNNNEIPLTDYNQWKEIVYTINATGSIILRITTDTANSLLITDVMGVIGSTAQPWTQNPNETKTDNVTIGKGIKVESSTSNTYTRIDADGNRTYNKSTNEIVSRNTETGTETKNLKVIDGAEIAKLSIQEVDSQIWLSSLI